MTMPIEYPETEEEFLERVYYKHTLLIRNGRWGTCVDCPRDEDGTPYPEECVNTNRHDHLLKA